MTVSLAETDRAGKHQDALVIERLSFLRKEGAVARSIFDNLDLSIPYGEIIALMGPSGCGKSTLLDLVAGLLTPESGLIRMSGQERAPCRIGYIFQRDALLPWRTVQSNLMLAAEVQHKAEKAILKRKMFDFMRSFNLAETIANHYPHQLSGGMRQRVNIIQTLMFDPDIILLDEPFSSLDLHTRQQLQAEFHRFCRSQRKTVLVVTHEIEEAIVLADRVLVMGKRGNISSQHVIARSAADSPDEIRESTLCDELMHELRSALRKVFADG